MEQVAEPTQKSAAARPTAASRHPTSRRSVEWPLRRLGRYDLVAELDAPVADV